MNNNLSEAQKLTSEVVNMVADEVRSSAQIVIIPPYIHLKLVKNLLKGESKISLGAQNLHPEDSGAFTGEVSGPMLSSYQVKYVVIGHSERREYFNEDEAFLKAKVLAALRNDITPIFCCGESLDVREDGKHEEFVEKQLQNSLFSLSSEDFSKVVIAYEPIWAIGTGKTASTEQAQEMHAHIRNLIKSKYDNAIADEISILYGGSMKPGNAEELIACPDVDGGLIGGASLKSRDFVDIAKAVKD